ncbi:nudix hydrolase 14 [Lophiostoma macrostomum CBS 122681]|uniref:Nudix hydrolase 14 n=1 Tax=Lophiostoma macrostomum CBS 122681 TaxID=1314788 RepID=A0A6A6SPN3_9PLEO|nr:nudix hydrolase 14 [Lophiostoma macrostomum CBS 122681]
MSPATRSQRSSCKDKSFVLNGFPDPVEVMLTHGISEEQLLEFPAFIVWQNTLRANLELQKKDPEHAFHNDPYSLRSIKIQSVDWFTDTKLGFVKLEALILNSGGPRKKLPGIAFLRGGSVAMLMILRPKDRREDRLVVMTEQPRVPAGSLAFREIPAGMIDKEKNFAGAAAKEIEEETGFKLPQEELLDLTALALQNSQIKESSLQNAMYPSPGGSDEYMPIFLWEKELDRQEIEDLRGKLKGVRTQGEMITLRVCPYEDLWKEGARDAKTLAAWALYEGLNRAGVIQDEMKKRNLGIAERRESV